MKSSKSFRWALPVVGACALALGGCGSTGGVVGASGASPRAWATTGTATPDEGTTPDGSSTGGASPTASAATSPTGVASASPSADSTGVVLACDSVLVEVWPESVEQPTQTGWNGPTCTSEVESIALTWTFAGGDPAPEVTDAAFVALTTEFKGSGWTVEGAHEEIREGTAIAKSPITSPDGLQGNISYESGGQDPAELTVDFHS